MDYLFHVLVLASLYSALAVSLDLVVGQAGRLSVAHAAFYGIGSYCSALLAVRFEVPFLVGVGTGIVLSASVSLIVSLASLRLHGDYFVIATFALQMILFSMFNNWMDLTRGPLGIPGIPQPIIFGWHVNSQGRFLVLAILLAAFAYLVIYRLSSSPFGRVLHAIREDEVLAKSLGKNTLRFKLTAFAVSGAIAAMAGGLYAHYITFVDPTSFTVMESILIISMIVIGGAGSTWGPLVGAILLVILPEVLRFVGLPSAVAANLRQIIYGSLLVIMMMFRPRGLVGKYGFNK